MNAERPAAALHLLKWFPGALAVLRWRYREYDGDTCRAPVLDPRMMRDVLHELYRAGLILAAEHSHEITALGIEALETLDADARPAANRHFAPAIESDPDPNYQDRETLPLDFETPRRMPAFAFRAGK